MANLRTLAALATIPVLVGGWALFRPELLFVDQKVSEKAPVAGDATTRTIGMGVFASYAHETTGDASLVKAGGTTYLRLSNFKTSNGPDVHVYLVKGSDPKDVKGGTFLDLGSIKGNVGDQNYAIPAGTDLAQYGSVNVWCKRFGVGFGGAPLTPDRTASRIPSDGFRLAGFGGSEIVVTHGRLGKGEAAIIEVGGKRFLRVTNPAGVKGAHIVLVKAETITGDATVTASPKIDLGALRPGTQQFPLSKEIDAWLYRSVSLWNGEKSLATAALRSDQERHAFVPTTLWI